MKAYVLHAINEFGMEEVPMPEPKDDEVLIKVRAAGICGSDIPRIFVNGTYSYPLIPGHEFAGVVISLGEKADKELLNKRVGVFPLLFCGKCEQCLKKQYEMCASYSYLGSRTNGGYAEYVAVPKANIIPLPKNVSFESAAMLEPMAVAVHAMRRIAPQKEDTVAIYGLGTIGLLLYMFLKDAGIENVFVVGNKDSQKKTMQNLGLSQMNFCDMRTENVADFIQMSTDGRGIDVSFECVGKQETLSQAVENAAPAGRIMTIGNPYSDMTMEKKVYWKILRRQLTIMGTWNSSFTMDAKDDWHYVLNRLEHGKIDSQLLITHRLPFDELMTGFNIMKDKKEDYIKIMGIIR